MKIKKYITVFILTFLLFSCKKAGNVPNLPSDDFNYTSEVLAKANALSELASYFDLDKEVPLVTTTEFNVTNKYVFPFIYGELFDISVEDLKIFGIDNLNAHVLELARSRALGEALYREAVNAGFTTTDASVDERVDMLAKGEMSVLLDELKNSPFTIDYIKTDYRHIIVIEKYKEHTISKCKTEVSDSEAKKYYKDNQDLVMSKPHAVVRHIFKDTAGMNDDQKSKAFQEMVALRSRIDNSSDFLSCVAKYSEDDDTKDDGGLVADYVIPGQTEETIDNVIFNMPETGGISDVVQSSFGIHIFMVDKIDPPAPRPFEELADQIKNIIVIERQNKAIDDEINRVTKKYRIKEVNL